MQLRAPVALIITALLVVCAGASGATARDEPAVAGEPVAIVDPDGIIRGSVTIRDVSDPFAAFDPSSPPAVGMRYVVLSVTFEAAPDQSLDAEPYQVTLQDTDGFLYAAQYVPRPADALSKLPDLQAQLMAPDNRISGAIGYVIPASATLDRVLYQPAYDRLIELVDVLPGPGPALGDRVTYTDATGASATIATQLIDPFTDFDPDYPPAQGMRFVMLQPAFENSGALPYWADPYDLVLRDAAGQLYSTTPVTRVPGFSVPLLESQTMSPGDRVSGYVGYSVPADVQLADVLYQPESARLVSIADLSGGLPLPAEPSATSAASPAPEVSPSPEVPPSPGVSPSPEASAGIGR